MKTIRLAIRGFADGNHLQFEERVEIPEDQLSEVLPVLGKKHANALVSHQLHMIEIEFLDEADLNQRFFRFGTDPAGMVLPIAINLSPED